MAARVADVDVEALGDGDCDTDTVDVGVHEELVVDDIEELAATVREKDTDSEVDGVVDGDVVVLQDGDFEPERVLLANEDSEALMLAERDRDCETDGLGGTSHRPVDDALAKQEEGRADAE